MNMDFSTFLVRAIGDTLFSTPPTHETKDIFDKIKDKCDPNKVTECVLKAMFCESTGTHYLDSGGLYGRGWQRAQTVKDLDWMEFPHVNVNIDKRSNGEYDFYLTKNTYQFLCEYIKYDVTMDKIFHTFCEEEARNRDSYYSNMEEFVKNIEAIDDYENKGGYNTYNGESCLDKTLQWNHFTVHDKEYKGDYLILQIHNGCDVRGGYSTPHIFRFDEDEFFCYLHDLSMKCPNYGVESNDKTVQLNLDNNKVVLEHVNSYSDDDGCHWYEDNDYKFVTDEDGEHKIVCGKCGAELNFY